MRRLFGSVRVSRLKVKSRKSKVEGCSEQSALSKQGIKGGGNDNRWQHEGYGGQGAEEGFAGEVEF